MFLPMLLKNHFCCLHYCNGLVFWFWSSSKQLIIYNLNNYYFNKILYSSALHFALKGIIKLQNSLFAIHYYQLFKHSPFIFVVHHPNPNQFSQTDTFSPNIHPDAK